MTGSAISTRYANALVDVITGAKAAMPPEQALGELRSFAEALAGSPELHNALVSPAVPPARKRAVVTRIAEQLGVSRVPRNFLCVLIDHRRIAALGAIIETAGELVDARLGFARARISSAQPISEMQRTAVVAELERLTGSRLRTLFTVDGNLIGGLVARIGSTVYDGSVKGRLENLGTRLAGEN